MCTARWQNSSERRGSDGLDIHKLDKDEATRTILQKPVDGKRNQGRTKLRCRDMVKEDIGRHQMTTEMTENRIHWHVTIQTGTLRNVEAER